MNEDYRFGIEEEYFVVDAETKAVTAQADGCVYSSR